MLNALVINLRARREQLRPETSGLAVGARLRVPCFCARRSLRCLPGISPLYVRLEQGRDTRPVRASCPTLLARALQLDGKGSILAPAGKLQPRSLDLNPLRGRRPAGSADHSLPLPARPSTDTGLSGRPIQRRCAVTLFSLDQNFPALSSC